MPHRLFFIPVIFIGVSSFGQKHPVADSFQVEIRNGFEKKRRLIDSSLHPIKYAKTLEEQLAVNFPQNSSKDGRWVFYKDLANIRQLNRPLVKAIIPNYEFYQVTLVNYLGWHVNQGTCVILFDSLQSTILLVEPLWYGGVSAALLKLFIGKKFDDKESLLNFFSALHELMETGSGYKFRQTSSSDSLLTFDLGYFRGDAYTTGGNGASSSVRYNEDGIWRQIIVEINNLKIIRYTAINPRMKNDKVVID